MSGHIDPIFELKGSIIQLAFSLLGHLNHAKQKWIFKSFKEILHGFFYVP